MLVVIKQQDQDPRPDRDYLGRGGVRGPAHPARRGLAAAEPGHAAAQQAAVQQVQRPPREGQSADTGDLYYHRYHMSRVSVFRPTSVGAAAGHGAHAQQGHQTHPGEGSAGAGAEHHH